MRFSESFIPTLREAPSEAELVSHKHMLRAGMIRKVAAGIYSYLPLGVRVIRKVEKIIREEMNRAGGQEVILPCLLPAELWQESGRWGQYGKELLRINDRHAREFCFGPTHEEAITALVRNEVRSYKQLPMLLYQIQTKFRDEIRPRFGVMRSREFVMKDAYSFHRDAEDAMKTYERVRRAYIRIFERCGLEYRIVEADTGMIGGNYSHEFMVVADSGEDEIVSCSACSYSANMEKATCKMAGTAGEAGGAEGAKELELVETPGKKTIADVAEFLKVPETEIVKMLIYRTNKGYVAALIRGDLQVNEAKLKVAMQAEEVKMATPENIRELFSVEEGYLGPVGLARPDVTVIADNSVRGMSNFVTGGNKEGYHFINCNHGRDFSARFADLMTIKEGDPCPSCGKGLTVTRGIEVGHIFILGDKYSRKMKAMFLDENGSEKPFFMGCYGVGVARTAAAAIEQHTAGNGVVWPRSIAPYQLVIIPLNPGNDRVSTTAELIYNSVMHYDNTLLDDRNERAGVKFKDAELIGAPYQLVISEKLLNDANVEFTDVKKGEKKIVPVEDIIDNLKELFGN